MDNLLFCDKHPEKIAKRNCKKCNQNLCNECVLDFHIDHHEEITKLEYSIDTKKTNFADLLSKDIKLIIDKTLEDLKPKIYQEVLKKTEEYIKTHKNLQLKINSNKTNPPLQSRRKSFKTGEKKEDIKITKPNHPGNKDPHKNKPTSSNPSNAIKEKAKLFTQKSKELPKNIDKNNPLNKGVKGNVNKMAKIFENQ
jgi:hypothetical protein